MSSTALADDDDRHGIRQQSAPSSPSFYSSLSFVSTTLWLDTETAPRSNTHQDRLGHGPRTRTKKSLHSKRQSTTASQVISPTNCLTTRLFVNVRTWEPCESPVSWQARQAGRSPASYGQRVDAQGATCTHARLEKSHFSHL